MFVYFIQRESGGPVKIGKSMRPDSRLKILQEACPETLQIVGVCAGGYPAEVQLHRWFAAQKLDGEWFDVSESLRALLNQLPTWDDLKAGAACPELLNNERTVLVELYRLGYTLEDLAGFWNLSRARIHQIITDHDASKAQRRWSYDPETKVDQITSVTDSPERCETRPEEPVRIAYGRLMVKHNKIDLMLPAHGEA